MSAPRFCKDCAHFVLASGKCLAAPRLDLVTGETDYFSAGTERGSGLREDCGPDARKFQPIFAEVPA